MMYRLGSSFQAPASPIRTRARRPRRPVVTLGVALFVGACVDVPAPLDGGTSPADATRDDLGFLDARSRDLGSEADTGERPSCTPALTLEPATRAIAPLDVLTLVARGGTGAYTFALVDAPSGAIVNELLGVYLAGETTGVVDRVRVTDRGCVGEAEAMLRVVAPLAIVPRRLELLPSTRVQLEVRGGSGRHAFSLVTATAGSTISASGAYVAARVGGRDLVRVTDLETMQTADARVVITASAALTLAAERFVIPVGARHALGAQGGSGEITLVGAPPELALEGDALVGRQMGAVDAVLRDRFAGLERTVRVDVVAPQTVPAARAGNGFLFTQVMGPGDLDGDGQRDAIVATTDHDLTAHTGGALFIYRGQAGTLSGTVARALGGASRYEEFGRAFAVADLDGDGLLDLVVGAPRADLAATDSGAVRIYPGQRGAFFAERPSRELSGRFASDLFGTGVAVCDFNGDGRLDLAVGARTAENRDVAPIATDQGGVFLFLQRDGGFRDEPDQAVYGVVPAAGGVLENRASIQLGTTIAAGDLDGDGACELVAASTEYDRNPDNNTNDGFVLVYRGVRAGGAGSRGGITAAPVRGYANDVDADSGGAFGRNLLVVELDGDGRAELVVSHHNFDQGTGDNHGAVRVFRGAALPSTPVERYALPSTADWSYEHDGDGDGFGFQSAAADVTGDGVLDLVVGAIRDEVMGGPNNTGAVFVFPGRSGALPEATRPTRGVSGFAGGDNFGGAVGAVGDLDADGRAEVVAFALVADGFGRDVGAPYLVPGTAFEEMGGARPIPLGFPGVPAGLESGRGADLVGDLDRDGFMELVVGNPRDSATRGTSSGSAFVYRGVRGGFERTPSAVIRDFTGHGNQDVFGQAVSRAGDFDGDGFLDVAIVARQEDRPETYPASYQSDPSCAGLGAATDVGAVYVFRGSAAGLVTNEPAFVFYGAEAGDVIETVAGGFDFDGDGLGDLAVGSPTWDVTGAANAGGFAIVRGRAAVPGRTLAVCAFDFVHHAAEANAQLGRGLAALGDVDGDGCDDVAAGAPGDDLGTTDQGSVRVVFGFGLGGRCGATARMATFFGNARGAAAGFALAAGPDFDGDGRGDLGVGLPSYTTRGQALGAALVLSSRTIAAAPTAAPRDGLAPVATTALSAFSSGTVAVGSTPGGRFGQSVAFVAGSSGTALAVGVPLGAEAGVALAGSAQLLRYSATRGFDARPALMMAGETQRPLGRIGEWVVGRGQDLVVAGYDGQGGGLDLGSVYVLRP
jgi:hypothetical protein